MGYDDGWVSHMLCNRRLHKRSGPDQRRLTNQPAKKRADFWETGYEFLRLVTSQGLQEGYLPAAHTTKKQGFEPFKQRISLLV